MITVEQKNKLIELCGNYAGAFVVGALNPNSENAQKIIEESLVLGDFIDSITEES